MKWACKKFLQMKKHVISEESGRFFGKSTLKEWILAISQFGFVDQSLLVTIVTCRSDENLVWSFNFLAPKTNITRLDVSKTVSVDQHWFSAVHYWEPLNCNGMNFQNYFKKIEFSLSLWRNLGKFTFCLIPGMTFQWPFHAFSSLLTSLSNSDFLIYM